MNEALESVLDKHQRRELSDMELDAIQQPITFEEALPADLAAALKLLMEPYPSDPLCSTLIFAAAMSGVLKLGTGINHRTKVMPANLYVCPVARTGTTKSSVFDELVEFPLALVKAEVARVNAEALEKHLNLPRATRPKRPPMELLCVTSDITPEALVAHFVRQAKDNRPLLLAKDEASEYFERMVLDMKQGRGSSMGLFLECFDGKGRTKSTRGDGVMSYPASKLSFVACIQPEILTEMMGTTDYAGKWSRLLTPVMPTRLLKLEDSDLSEAEGQEYDEARQLLRELALELYELDPQVYELTAEARAHVNAWFRPYLQKAIDPTTPQIMQSMFNKGMAHALRIAVVLHVFHTKGKVLKVPLERIQMATRTVDACFGGTIRMRRGNAGANKLLQHIQTTTLKAKRPMTWQEIKGKGDDEIRSLAAQDFNDLVPVMVEMGIGEQGLRKRSITYMGTKELAA
tara:strand:+ start:1042 stop:2421 length:1380 start_codon:yes stop_codon:yes gene_type:complete